MPFLSPSPAEDGSPQALPSERRRSARFNVTAPVLAALTRPSDNRDSTLLEVRDLSESGMGIHIASGFELSREEEFCLDLSGPEGFVRAGGRVAWQDSSGRIGIQFTDIAEPSRRCLEQWLAARRAEASTSEQATSLGQPEKVNGHGPKLAALFEDFEPAPPDYTTLLSALAAVRREVESLGKDLDAALHLIARRAQAFTRATGAAIALTEGAEMICRATAGPDTPALGARLKIGSGFSGECVRSDKLLRCDDAEADPRVDHESCRILGIRSMMAVPIRARGVVTGLLEVFARASHVFTSDEEVVLEYLAGLASDAARRSMTLEVSPAPLARQVIVDDEFPIETPADLPLPRLLQSRNVAFISAVATVVLAVGWLNGPWSGRRSATDAGTAQPQAGAQSSAAQAPNSNTLDGLRRLAQQGDASAQVALGDRYATGEDVPQSYLEAFHWISQAAEQGNVTAEATLSTYYEKGRGVLPDLVQAYYWALLAQAGGDDASKARVASLALRLAPSRVADAQLQASAWIKQHPQMGNSSVPTN